MHNHVCIKCLVCKFLFYCKNRNKYISAIFISVGFVRASHNYLLNMLEPKSIQLSDAGKKLYIKKKFKK